MSKRQRWKDLAEELAHEALIWQDEGHHRDNSFHVGVGNGIKYAAKRIAETLKTSKRSHDRDRHIPVE